MAGGNWLSEGPIRPRRRFGGRAGSCAGIQQFEAAAPSEPVGQQKGVLADSAHESRATAALRKEAAPSSAAPID